MEVEAAHNGKKFLLLVLGNIMESLEEVLTSKSSEKGQKLA